MRIGSTLLLLVSSLSAQVEKPTASKPSSNTLELRLRAQAMPLSPQEMLRSMVARDQARRSQPGATVEVIGYDEEAALKLLAITIRDQVRLEFRTMDKEGEKELYAFLHQDPNRPGPAPMVPMLAGAKVFRPEDKWLK